MNHPPDPPSGTSGVFRSEWLAWTGSLIDRHRVWILLLVFGVLATLLLATKQFATGDEPRYLLYALSFIRHGTLVMPAQEWSRVVVRLSHHRAAGLPTGGDNVVLLNGVYLPVLLSPIAGLLSLEGLRAASLLSGLWGLWCLHGLLRRVGGPVSALATLVVLAFSLPLLPYLHLFYMEAFLFALVCWAWARLQFAGRSQGGNLLTAAILCSIPMVHPRGSAVAVLLGVILLWQMWRDGGRRTIALVLALAVIAGAALIGANLWIYGAITGPVNTARPPGAAEWFPVLAMQLFNVHHGLLAYAPIWVAGWAGLLCVFSRGGLPDPARRILRQALFLAVVAAVTGVGVNPGECWPARFWVLSMPMLAVGLCFWLHRVRGTLPALCCGLLLLITLLNTVLFVSHPNMFLDDRQTSTTYDALFTRFGSFDANMVLPVETDDAQDAALARNLALGAVAMSVALAMSLHRRGAGLVALVLLLAVFDLAHVRRVDPSEYRVLAGPDTLSVVFQKPMRHPAIVLGNTTAAWFGPPTRLRFDEMSTGLDGVRESMRAANQVVVSSCIGLTRSLAIRDHGLDLQFESKERLLLLESRSLLLSLGGQRVC